MPRRKKNNSPKSLSAPHKNHKQKIFTQFSNISKTLGSDKIKDKSIIEYLRLIHESFINFLENKIYNPNQNIYSSVSKPLKYSTVSSENKNEIPINKPIIQPIPYEKIIDSLNQLTDSFKFLRTFGKFIDIFESVLKFLTIAWVSDPRNFKSLVDITKTFLDIINNIAIGLKFVYEHLDKFLIGFMIFKLLPVFRLLDSVIQKSISTIFSTSDFIISKLSSFPKLIKSSIESFVSFTKTLRSAISSGEGFRRSLKKLTSSVLSASLNILRATGTAFYNSLKLTVGAFSKLLTPLLLLSPIFDTFREQFSSVSTSFSNAFKPLIDAIAVSSKVLKPALENIAGTFGSVISKLLPQISSFLNSFFNFIASVLYKLAPFLERFLTTLITNIGNFIYKILPSLSKLFDKLLPVFASFVDDLFPVFILAIEEITPPLIDIATEILPPLVELLKYILIPAIKTIAFLTTNVIIPTFKILSSTISSVIKAFNLLLSPFSSQNKYSPPETNVQENENINSKILAPVSDSGSIVKSSGIVYVSSGEIILPKFNSTITTPVPVPNYPAEILPLPPSNSNNLLNQTIKNSKEIQFNTISNESSSNDLLNSTVKDKSLISKIFPPKFISSFNDLVRLPIQLSAGALFGLVSTILNSLSLFSSPIVPFIRRQFDTIFRSLGIDSVVSFNTYSPSISIPPQFENNIISSLSNASKSNINLNIYQISPNNNDYITQLLTAPRPINSTSTSNYFPNFSSPSSSPSVSSNIPLSNFMNLLYTIETNRRPNVLSYEFDRNNEILIPNYDKMTIKEVVNYVKSLRSKYNLSPRLCGAFGAFQFCSSHSEAAFRQWSRLAGLNYESDLFTIDNQAKLAQAMIKERLGPNFINKLKSGALTPERFISSIAPIWPSLPGGKEENNLTKSIGYETFIKAIKEDISRLSFSSGGFSRLPFNNIFNLPVYISSFPQSGFDTDIGRLHGTELINILPNNLVHISPINTPHSSHPDSLIHQFLGSYFISKIYDDNKYINESQVNNIKDSYIIPLSQTIGNYGGDSIYTPTDSRVDFAPCPPGKYYRTGESYQGFSISSGYGLRKNRMHYGVDIAAPEGTPISFGILGLVTKNTFESGGFGHYIEIKGIDNFIYRFAHLSTKSPLQPNTIYVPGLRLGLVGNTGRSYGSHLHFERNYISTDGSRERLNPHDFIDYLGFNNNPPNKICFNINNLKKLISSLNLDNNTINSIMSSVSSLNLKDTVPYLSEQLNKIIESPTIHSTLPSINDIFVDAVLNAACFVRSLISPDFVCPNNTTNSTSSYNNLFNTNNNSSDSSSNVTNTSTEIYSNNNSNNNKTNISISSNSSSKSKSSSSSNKNVINNNNNNIPIYKKSLDISPFSPQSSNLNLNQHSSTAPSPPKNNSFFNRLFRFFFPKPTSPPSSSYFSPKDLHILSTPLERNTPSSLFTPTAPTLNIPSSRRSFSSGGFSSLPVNNKEVNTTQNNLQNPYILPIPINSYLNTNNTQNNIQSTPIPVFPSFRHTSPINQLAFFSHLLFHSHV